MRPNLNSSRTLIVMSSGVELGDWRLEKERESLFSNTVFGSFWYRCELCVVPALITRQPRTFCCADDDDSLLHHHPFTASQGFA